MVRVESMSQVFLSGGVPSGALSVWIVVEKGTASGCQEFNPVEYMMNEYDSFKESEDLL